MSAAEKSAVRNAPNVGALALKVYANPTQEEFQKLALAHTPNMLRTARGPLVIAVTFLVAGSIRK